jgi:ornithine decarboxylase
MREVLTENPEQSFCFLNEGGLHDRAEFMQEHFLPDYPGAVVAYAVKVNSRRRILEILYGAGITHFDCASPNEIQKVLDIDPNSNPYYNHPVVFERNIRDVQAMGVRHFTVQTQRGIERVLNNTDPHTPENPLEITVRMQTLNDNAAINLSTKFGAKPRAVRDMIEFISGEGYAIPGVAVNTGSQNKDPDTYRKAIFQVSEVVSGTQARLGTINLGGGLPVEYFDDEKFDLKDYFRIINEAVMRVLGDVFDDNEGKVIIEPGRAIIGPAVDLLIAVIDVEERDGKMCAYIDDGVYTSFSDSIIHGWKYNFKPYSVDGKPFSDERVPWVLFGRTCDSGDVVKNVRLPINLRQGNYLWINHAGAYMDSQSSNFNNFPPHQYISYNS